MSRRRPRTAFAPLNSLQPVIEESESSMAKESPPKEPQGAKEPLISPKVEVTANEIAEAEAALARMEADLAKAKQLDSPVQRLRKSPVPEDDSDSSSSSSDDDDEENKKRWSTAGRRASSRRSSVQHLSAKEQRALRRLSQILRDGGEARRAQERRESLRQMKETQKVREAKRRESDRRRRMCSIAKLIDLSKVWDWLERIDTCDEDCGCDEEEESIEESIRKDSEAVAIVENIDESTTSKALGIELGLIFYEHDKKKHLVHAALEHLYDLRPLSPQLVDYDLNTGIILVKSSLSSPRVSIIAQRTWRDFCRLKKGLEIRGVPKHLIPNLPRPRAFSEAKKVFRNVMAPAKKRGERKWQKSKIGILQSWLDNVLKLLFTDATTNKRRTPAQEHLEDFLLKYAHVRSPRRPPNSAGAGGSSSSTGAQQK